MDTSIVPAMQGKRSLRDAIIGTLSAEWPLTTRRIYHHLRAAGFEVSYQAVHKTIKNMVSEEVLAKDGKEYRISLGWTERVEQFTQTIRNIYKQSVTATEVLVRGHANLTFSTVIEMYRFFLDLMISPMTLPVIEKTLSVAYLRHLWFALLGSEREQKDFRTFMTKAKGIVFVRKKSPLDSFLAAYYRELGGAKIRIVLSAKHRLSFDRLVLGDFIADVYYPKSITEVFDSAYSNGIDLSKSHIDRLYRTILYKEVEINVTIYKNPKLAHFIRNAAIKDA